MRRWSFAKGHGTMNDFVVLLDRENVLEFGPAEVRAICDRRAGVGGDGVLRAVSARYVEEWTGEGDVWFMDYRNADGSIAEMCGNGVRVFARYLLDEGLANPPIVGIATRAGRRDAEQLPDGRIRVAMGAVQVAEDGVEVTAAGSATTRAISVDVGNPHAVSFVEDLAVLDLEHAPTWAPAEAFPQGVNLEFVQVLGERHIGMRVFERGVGETMSCGTGTVAAAAATALRSGDEVRPVTYRVDIPGGTVEVELTDDQSYLTGPAVIVAHGELTLFSVDATEE